MSNELNTFLNEINRKRKFNSEQPIDASTQQWLILDHIYDELAPNNLHAASGRTPLQARKRKQFLELAKEQLLETV